MEYEKVESRWTLFLANLSVGKIIALVIAGIIVYSITKKGTDPTYNKILWVGMFIIIIYLYFRPKEGKKLLERWEAVGIAQRELNRMIRDGEFFFDSKIYIKPASKLRYMDDLVQGTAGPISWNIGFVEEVHGKKYLKEGVISIHPYNGTVTGIKEAPTGFTGNEIEDVQKIPVTVVAGTMSTTDFANGAQK